MFHLGDHGSDFAFGDASGRGNIQFRVGDVAALAVDHRRVLATTKMLLNPKTFSKIV